MNLSRNEAIESVRKWLVAWNEHDLVDVMSYLHENIIFENFTGEVISGKGFVNKAWTPWFINHGNFRFIEEDIFFDEAAQKMLLKWRLEWPSTEVLFKGKPEIRRGTDVLYFFEGKIIKKHSYSKTSIQIEDSSIALKACY
jgi:hypothetical protein